MDFLNITKSLFSARKTIPYIPLTDNKKRAAFVISRIFGPVPLLIFLWLLTAFKSGIGFWKAIWVYPLILVLALLIPTLVTSFFITKRKTDIEWKNITDRKKYLFPVVVASVLILNILVFFLTIPTVFHLSLLFSAIILSMTIIWLVFNFKISGHMIVATLAISGVNLFFGLHFFWLYLLLIPIMWARLTLKVHSFPELIAGVLLPAVFMLAALAIFGWPNV